MSRNPKQMTEEVLASPEWTRRVVLAAANALWSMEALDKDFTHTDAEVKIAGVSQLRDAFINWEQFTERMREANR